MWAICLSFDKNGKHNQFYDDELQAIRAHSKSKMTTRTECKSGLGSILNKIF